MKPEERNALDQSCLELEKTLKSADIRTHYDARDNYSSGWKFNHWELKVSSVLLNLISKIAIVGSLWWQRSCYCIQGVPIRIELGPKDIKQNQVVAVRRDTGAKLNFKRDSVTSDVNTLLKDIQQALYNK